MPIYWPNIQIRKRKNILSAHTKTRYLQNREYEIWDKFVDESPQGTICSKTLWLYTVCKNFFIVGCFRENSLVAGICFEVVKIAGLKIIKNPLLTPFIGIHYAHNSGMNPNKQASLEKDLLNQILAFLEKDYKRIVINNHYSVRDIRIYNWRNYSSSVRYTYVVDLSDINKAIGKIESRTNYEIRKCEKNSILVDTSQDVGSFFNLVEMTYKRKGLESPVGKQHIEKIFTSLNSISKCKLYFAKDSAQNCLAAIFIIWDKNTAYYLMGANNPDFRKYGASNLLLKKAMEDLAEMGVTVFDLCGANDPGIALFKRGFGGELKAYYRNEKVNFFPLKIAQGGFNIFNFIKRQKKS